MSPDAHAPRSPKGEGGLSPPTDASLRRRGMTLSLWEGVFATVFTAITQGVFAVAYVELLGGTYFHYALLGAIPTLATVAQVFTGYHLQFAERRKWFTTATSVLFRAIWAPVLLLPFFLSSRGAALTAFLALYAVSFVIFNASANAWTGWMTELVPSRIRGRYFGRRNLASTMAAVATLFVGGQFVDRWREYAAARALVEAVADLLPRASARWAGDAVAYGLLFLLAASMSVICGVLLALQHEPRRKRAAAPAARASLAESWRATITDKRFQGLLLFAVFFNLLNGPAAPFWTPFMIKHVGVSIAQIAQFGMIGNAARVVALFFWGRWIDRYGSRPILGLCIAIASIHPLYYVVARPGLVWPLYLDAISSGLVWGGIELAIFKLLLAAARPERKEMYFAVYVTATGLAFSATQLLAGHLIDDLVALEWVASSRSPLVGIFVFTTVARLACLFMLRWIHEPAASSFGDTVRRIARGPERTEPAPEVRNGLGVEGVVPQAKVVEVKGIEPSTS